MEVSTDSVREMKARLSDWNANRHNFLIDRDRSISCDSDPTWRFEPAGRNGCRALDF